MATHGIMKMALPISVELKRKLIYGMFERSTHHRRRVLRAKFTSWVPGVIGALIILNKGNDIQVGITCDVFGFGLFQKLEDYMIIRLYDYMIAFSRN